MKLIFSSVCTFLLVLLAASANAKTLKYELQDIFSHNGEINYPGLDFHNAQSATLTVEKLEGNPTPELVSLDLVFPEAATLKVRGFVRQGPDTYRALVPGAWIFREVLVQLQIPELSVGAPVQIMVKVVEGTSYLNPIVNSVGPDLLIAHGILKDVTPSKVVDTGFAVVEGKRVNLSLKDRLGFGETSPQFGFAIDALWLGNGQKTLYLHAPIPFEEFDFVEPIALLIEAMNGPNGIENMVSVKYILAGEEQISPPFPLAELLNQAYGQ